jgi:hypothetical protein
MAFENDKKILLAALKFPQSAIRKLTGIKISFYNEFGFRRCRPKKQITREVYGFNWYIAIGFIIILYPCSNHH